MTRQRILIGFVVAVVSLSWMIETPGKSLVNGARAAETSEAVNRQDHLQAARGSLLAGRTVNLSARVRTRLRGLGAKGCGCALTPEDEDAFGSCMKNCLTGWGISATTVLACGGACVSAGTGNPFGIALCAGCLGTGEWIVAGCAMSCVWSPGGGGGRGTILGKNLSDRRRTQAKLKIKVSAPRVS